MTRYLFTLVLIKENVCIMLILFLFCRLTYVAIEKTTGKISITKCSCEQNAGGKCSHIGCLCYLIEHFKLDPASVRIKKACTSKLQAWGQGKKKLKNPGPVHEKDYNKKISSQIIKFDPRPANFRNKKSKQDLTNFISNLETIEMKEAAPCYCTNINCPFRERGKKSLIDKMKKEKANPGLKPKIRSNASQNPEQSVIPNALGGLKQNYEEYR